MADQLTLQPFFDALGQPSAPHAAGVNATATARMERVLKSPVDAPGRGMLLRAPRAGYGKTHLLSHVQQVLGTTHEFLPLSPLDGSRTDAAGAIEGALRRLTRPLPAGGGLTNLDLLARRLFALSLQPLVNSGEVPCQDREAALSALRQRPVETFDFHHSQAVTAHWTKENFEVLGPRLALELSRRTGSSLNETSFWLASLFRFAIAVPEHPGRTGMIIQSSTVDAGVERYAALLALLSLISRVVVTADDLEGMHAEPMAALRFASFLAAVRQDAPRVDVVVSLNDDIWESAFIPALSGGLLDRISEIEIRLDPLDEAATAALLEVRLPGQAAALARQLALSPGEFYARKVLRRASELQEEEADKVPVLEPSRIDLPSRIAPGVASDPFGGFEANDGAVSLPPAHQASPHQAFQDAPSAEEVPVVTPLVEEEPEPAFEAPVEILTPAGETSPTVKVLEESPESESPFSPAPQQLPPALPPKPEVPEPVATSQAQAQEAAPPFSPSQSPFASFSSESPFSIAQPEEKPAAAASEEEVAAGAGGDRIDDLLRQFRERYGRE